MLQRRAVVLLSIFLLPLFSVGITTPVGTASAAIDDCKGELSQIVENETLSRHAEVPNNNNWWFLEDYEEDGPGKRQSKKQSDEGTYPFDPALSPEEEWMYMSWDRDSRLQRMTYNHHSTMLVGNDSIGALRVNLSEQHRTTICITVQALNETNDDYSVDVYLMTTSEFQRYTELYYSSHSEQSFYADVSEALSDISPEWRSLDFTGWRSYRDAHQYESVNEINFALNLDGPESYTPLFGSERWQDFYIVIDTWDNNHDNDAPAPGVVTAADVTIITTERSFVLPNYTVAIIFLMMIIGMVIFPFILNARYMKAGLDVSSGPTEPGLVPSLEVDAELPEYGQENDLEGKNYPDISQDSTGD